VRRLRLSPARRGVQAPDLELLSTTSASSWTSPRRREVGLQQVRFEVQILHRGWPNPLLCGPQSPQSPVLLNSPLWTRACTDASRRSKRMLWTIFVVLVVLWALGMVTSYTASGLIHILLVVALVILAIRLIQGRRIA
jgi:hypothetical protein